MSEYHQRADDDVWIKRGKFLVGSVVQVGFSVAMCCWLLYRDYVKDESRQKTMVEFREVLTGLKTSVDLNNKLLRHKHVLEDPD